MDSSKNLTARSYSLPDDFRTAYGNRVKVITRHAIDQCMKRERCSPQKAANIIKEILTKGIEWESPGGPALRLGLCIIGWDWFEGDRHKGAVVVTYYQLNAPPAVRQYYKEATGQFQLKPGRKSALNRLKRQRKHCRHPHPES